MSDWWQDYPWRLIQTNLREIDMLDIDAEQVVRDLQAFKANVLMINAAGIIASYPTELPFHFQSPYLTGRQPGRHHRGLPRADIRVCARTDFSKVRRPIYEAHPEWAYVSPAGEIVDYNGDVHMLHQRRLPAGLHAADHRRAAHQAAVRRHLLQHGRLLRPATTAATTTAPASAPTASGSSTRCLGWNCPPSRT